VTEQTLHEQLKELYAQESGEMESSMGEYRVDVVRGNLLIEIQTSSFSSIRDKLKDMIQDYRVRLVHPIAYRKWIVRLDENRKQVSRRKSPKRGRVEEVFYELVYMPELTVDPNFELEVALIDLDEYWIDDGRGSWRRRRWSIYDKQMIELHERYLFKSPEDFKKLIPENMLSDFTSKMLSKKSGLKMSLAQKMLYCLTRMNVIARNGKKGRAYLYRLC
jgi:hypothetical protein